MNIDTRLVLPKPVFHVLCNLACVVSTFTYIMFLYVLRDHELSVPLKIVALVWESLLFAIFLLDSVMDCATSFSKTGYLISFTGITDVVSLLGLTTFFYLDFYTALTLQFFRCFRLLKILQIVKSYPHLFHYTFDEPVSYEILHTVTSISVLMLVVTGTVQAVSYQYPISFETPESVHASDSIKRMYWHECFYFVVVTVTTVGYGDIIPVSTLSRLLMVVIIVVAFSLIPRLLSDLVKAFYARPPYSGCLNLPLGCKHIVVCGIVNSAMLMQLLIELQRSRPVASTLSTTDKLICDETFAMPGYSAETEGANNKVLVVILSPELPSRRVKLLLDAVLANYARRVLYFVGSTSVPNDLKRVKLEDALAVIIMGDELTTSMRAEEDSIFLCTMSVSMYLDNNVANASMNERPRIVTTLTHTAKLSPLMRSAGVDVAFPLQRFKYNLIGVATACPGFLALFMKLNRPFFESYAQTHPQHFHTRKMHKSCYPTVSASMECPQYFVPGSEFSLYQITLSQDYRDDKLKDHKNHASSDSNPTKKHRRREIHAHEICPREGDEILYPELGAAVRQLPEDINFHDFISVVYRLSKGSVIVVGCKKRSPSSLPQQFCIVVNPGTGTKLKDCTEIFCISSSRSSAASTFRQACINLTKRQCVRGPRGTAPIGSLESLSGNRLLHSNSRNPSSNDEDTTPPQHEKQVYKFQSLPDEKSEKIGKSLQKSVSSQLAKSINSKGLKPRLHQRTKLSSASLKRLSPFSKNDNSSVSGRSVTSTNSALMKPSFSRLKRRKRGEVLRKTGADTCGNIPRNTPGDAVVDKNDHAYDTQSTSSDSGASNDISNLSNRSEPKDSSFKGHLVIVLASSGTADTISANSLILPVVYFLTAYRAHSPYDDVIILSERADELHKIADDASIGHEVLKDIFFFQGSPRNIDHLRCCHVMTARSVAVIHPPTPATLYVQADDDPSGRVIPSKLNADRLVIIISLNLHFLVEQQFQLPQRDHNDDNDFLRNDMHCPFTFTIAELRHDSNVTYLRRSIRTISFLSSDSIRRNSRYNRRGDNDNCIDLLSAGGVLTAPVFVSLLVRAILNPDVIDFWEAMLTDGIKYATPDEEPKQREQNDCRSRGADGGISSSQYQYPVLGRIAVPQQYVGLPYSLLFEDLLERAGIVCIGLHRLEMYRDDEEEAFGAIGEDFAEMQYDVRKSPSTSKVSVSVPHVFVVPKYNDFLLSDTDFLIILHPIH